jgi:ankyrin repeat protein
MTYGSEPKLSLDKLPTEIIREIADCLPTEEEVLKLMISNRRLHHHLKDYLCIRNIKDGGTGIFWVCQNGQIEACQRFLELGADPNAESRLGYNYISRSLLNIAIFSGHIEVAQILLIYGADPNAKDDSGDTPLFPAVRNCDAPMVQMLLEMRADPNVRNENGSEGSPLEIALANDLAHIVELLLEKGAGTSV